MQTIATSPAQARRHAAYMALLAALAGLMFGLDAGVISGAQQFIQRQFGVIELIVSFMTVGAALGAALAAWLSVHFGRKRSQLWMCGATARGQQPGITWIWCAAKPSAPASWPRA